MKELAWRKYGGWWTSVSGWDGWAWFSTCSSVSSQSTTSLRFTVSVWSTCRVVEPAHPLHPSLPAGLRASALTYRLFLCGCGHRSSCFHTYSSSSSCSPVRELTLELLGTVYFLSVLPCSAAAGNLPANWPIRGACCSLTHRGWFRCGIRDCRTNETLCTDADDVTSCVPLNCFLDTPVGYKLPSSSVRRTEKVRGQRIEGSD